MATIDTYLEDIKNKVYGEDVRDAIHDGILQCYQDSTANAQIERIIEKGQETYDSIPGDYTTLSNSVSDLRAAIHVFSNTGRYNIKPTLSYPGYINANGVYDPTDTTGSASPDFIENIGLICTNNTNGNIWVSFYTAANESAYVSGGNLRIYKDTTVEIPTTYPYLRLSCSNNNASYYNNFALTEYSRELKSVRYEIASKSNQLQTNIDAEATARQTGLCELSNNGVVNKKPVFSTPGYINSNGVYDPTYTNGSASDEFIENKNLIITNNTNGNIWVSFYKSKTESDYVSGGNLRINNGATVEIPDIYPFIRICCSNNNPSYFNNFTLYSYSEQLEEIQNDISAVVDFGGIDITPKIEPGAIVNGAFDATASGFASQTFIKNDRLLITNKTGSNIWVWTYSSASEEDVIERIYRIYNGKSYLVDPAPAYIRVHCSQTNPDAARKFVVSSYSNALNNMKQPKFIDGLEFVGHRGLLGLAPMNTIPSYATAKKSGWHIFETDVRFTSDGIPVMQHDRDLEKNSNAPVGTYIDTNTYETLVAYNTSYKFEGGYPETHIPTFVQMLTTAKRLGMKVLIEIKENPDGDRATTPITTEQATTLINYIKALDMRDRVMFISFYLVSLEKILTIDNDFNIGYITDQTTITGQSVDDRNTIKHAVASVRSWQNRNRQMMICMPRTLDNNDTFTYLRDRGILVLGGVVNTTEMLSETSMYFNAISTNQLTEEEVTNSYIPT